MPRIGIRSSYVAFGYRSPSAKHTTPMDEWTSAACRRLQGGQRAVGVGDLGEPGRRRREQAGGDRPVPQPAEPEAEPGPRKGDPDEPAGDLLHVVDEGRIHFS
jgi:hypothetical protein